MCFISICFHRIPIRFKLCDIELLYLTSADFFLTAYDLIKCKRY